MFSDSICKHSLLFVKTKDLLMLFFHFVRAMLVQVWEKSVQIQNN